jgi:hypothetical protein
VTDQKKHEGDFTSLVVHWVGWNNSRHWYKLQRYKAILMPFCFHVTKQGFFTVGGFKGPYSMHFLTQKLSCLLLKRGSPLNGYVKRQINTGHKKMFMLCHYVIEHWYLLGSQCTEETSARNSKFRTLRVWLYRHLINWVIEKSHTGIFCKLMQQHTPWTVLLMHW